MLNLITTKVVWGVTPMKKWSVRKPSIKNIRTIGCIEWAYILDDNMNKLYSKSQCLDIQYIIDCLGPMKYDIIFRRDVIFDERILGVTLLNYSFNLFSSNYFKIFGNSRSTHYLTRLSNGQLTPLLAQPGIDLPQ